MDDDDVKLSQFEVAIGLHSESSIFRQCKSRVNLYANKYLHKDICDLCLKYYHLNGIPINNVEINELIISLKKQNINYSEMKKSIDRSSIINSEMNVVGPLSDINPMIFKMICSAIKHIERGHIFKKLTNIHLFDPIIIGMLDINSAIYLKYEGNLNFKSRNFDYASYCYLNTALHLGVDIKNNSFQNVIIKSEERMINKLKLITLNNNCFCYLQCGQYKKAIDLSSIVLQIDKNNEKALFRRAVAYRNIGLLNNAKKDLSLLTQIEYDNNNNNSEQEMDPALQRELFLLKCACLKRKEKEKETNNKKRRGVDTYFYIFYEQS